MNLLEILLIVFESTFLLFAVATYLSFTSKP